ncbi:MAG: Na+:H+ antiporter, NhaA family [Frankiaceae bacterium]|nr:Na+:H+ antiporter, NhaA family [Frankiaceae bacterium]MDQ1634061.1 Na+:H+ antiporter, NhaA family [Frankiaceae bacterium]MDQ1648671.1 Na+:H+ antiporter, NhaA family [Frankiaceae bacterium]
MHSKPDGTTDAVTEVRGLASSGSLFRRGSWTEDNRVAAVLRKETIGGLLLLVGSLVALVWSNSPWSAAYQDLRDTTVGPGALHLDLSLATWAADGLLAIFFFVAGLELKREFVAGDLRDPRRAALPVCAAVGGVLVPALTYVAVTAASGAPTSGWAIPTATDIAFALAVLAVIGSFLPAAMRTFLLTLAVVDDLLAITIIALFYTNELKPIPLLLALVPLGLFTLLVQRHIRSWWLLLPLAVVVWALVHASGVHATVAGVLLGFAVPVQRGIPGDGPGLAEHFEHWWRPISSGFAVPVFAFFSAGVGIGGLTGLTRSLADPVAIGIVVGLVVGKPVGILVATSLVSRFTRAHLSDDLAWIDVVGLAVLAGIGFTVSLLIGELAFGAGSALDDHVKVAVLTGSVVAALLAAVLLRIRNRVYRRICESEAVDTDAHGIPAVYRRSE